MIESLKNEIAQHGYKAAVIPTRRISEIRQDLENLKRTSNRNNFQQHILNGLYSFDVPEEDFLAESVIIVASPGPATIEIFFNWQGRTIPEIIPATYLDKTGLLCGLNHI